MDINFAEGSTGTVVQLLIAAATVIGVIALSVKRSRDSSKALEAQGNQDQSAFREFVSNVFRADRPIYVIDTAVITFTFLYLLWVKALADEIRVSPFIIAPVLVYVVGRISWIGMRRAGRAD